MTEPKGVNTSTHTYTHSYMHSDTHSATKTHSQVVLLPEINAPSKFGKSYHYPSFPFRLASWPTLAADTVSHITCTHL